LANGELNEINAKTVTVKCKTAITKTLFLYLSLYLNDLRFVITPLAIFKLFFTNCETNPAERSTNLCRRPEAFRIEDSILALITPYISSLFVNKSYALSADIKNTKEQTTVYKT
jgi:hypothetical protein